MTPSRPYHHGALAEALRDVAARLLAEEGVEALTLRRLAEAAGVSHAAPYRHFADKEALLAALAAEGFRRFAERLEAAAAGLAPRPAFRAQGRAYVAFATAERHLVRLMFGPMLSDRSRHRDLAEAAASAFAALERAVAAALGPAAPPRRRRETALACWATVHGLATLINDGQVDSLAPAGRAALVEATLDRLDGLLA